MLYILLVTYATKSEFILIDCFSLVIYATKREFTLIDYLILSFLLN